MYKAHLCAQRGRGPSSTMGRRRLQLPDPGTSLPGESRSRAGFCPCKGHSPLAGRPGQEGRWGGLRNNPYHHQKRRAPEKERGGSADRPCDPAGRGARVFPPAQQRAGRDTWGPAKPATRALGARGCVRNVGCCLLPHGTGNPDRNVHPKSFIRERETHRYFQTTRCSLFLLHPLHQSPARRMLPSELPLPSLLAPAK